MKPSSTDTQEIENQIEQGAGSGLDQLAGMAASIDAEITGTPDPNAPAPEPEPLPDVGPEIAGMLQLVVGMAAPALPFLPTCYTPDVCQQIGTAFAAVAEKHGWDVRGSLGPEVALAFVSIPPTIAAVVLGRQHFAAKRQAEQGAGRVESAGPVQMVEEVTGQQGERVMPGGA